MKDKISIFDTDLDLNKLESAMTKDANLSFLKLFGEISVSVDGEVYIQDDSFSAHVHGTLKNIDKKGLSVKNIEVIWSPTEVDLNYLLENKSEYSEEEQKMISLFEKIVNENPKQLIDISSVVSKEKIEELEELLINDSDLLDN